MMPQQQPPAAQQSDSSLDMIWLVVLIGVVLGLTWFFGRVYIIRFIFHLRLGEMALIGFFVDLWSKVASFLHLPLPDQTGLTHWRNIAMQADIAKTGFNELVSISNFVGSYLRYPILLILFLLGVMVYLSNVTQKFKTTFSMRRLRASEEKSWVQIMPMSKINLMKVKLDDGPWAMSISPMQFAKKHKLLKEEMKEGVLGVTVLRGAAQRVFSMQLGHPWSGFNTLPLYMQALFAVFAARIESDRENAAKLLKKISISSAAGKLDFTGAQALLLKHQNSKIVQGAIQRHAYVLTVAASLLALARADGVIAMPDFLWLKAVDRPLWYILSSVGRQTPFSEVAGIFAHWLAEKEVGIPLRVPMVERAVIALEEAIAAVKYTPDESVL